MYTMRLFVISDSHGDLFTLKTVLSRATGFDTIIHLGDGAPDLLRLSEITYGKKIISVQGNCDSSAYGYPLTDTFFLDGQKIFCCHGHTYGVKFGLTRLSLAAAEQNAKLCLFGHTHQPFQTRIDDVWFFNPGSVKNGCYGIVEAVKDKIIPINLSL